MKQCPKCGDALMSKTKYKSGLVELCILIGMVIVDIIFNIVPIFMYISAILFCVYYFFSKGEVYYECKNCRSDFHPPNSRNLD